MSKMTLFPVWFVAQVVLLFSLEVSHTQAQYSTHQVPDLCGSGLVESAERITLSDGSQKLFISSGKQFWLLNATGELPDSNNVQHLPFDFKPDVALIKDSTGCTDNGRKTLFLIQMKHSWDGKEISWNTLEGWIDGKDLNWGEINKIAHCAMPKKICTTIDDYFGTMSFDWSCKLDSAFGTIGETAYFIQGEDVFKVQYKSHCIKNPYGEVVSYRPFSLGTKSTAAMSFKEEDSNMTVVLVDHDMNYNFTAESLENIHFSESISNGGLWKINSENLFDQCPKLDSAFAFLAFDLFDSSTKHFAQPQMLIFVVGILILLILITGLVVGTTFLLMAKRSSPTGVYEVNDEGLIPHENSDSKIDSNDNGDKEKKTFLQTSC